MNQILLGAALPFLAGLVLYVRRGCRASPALLGLLPLWMILGALYAIAPDLPRLLGCRGLYARLALDPRTDVFLFHYTIDRIETDSPLYHAGLVAMCLLLLFAAWREIRLLEAKP